MNKKFIFGIVLSFLALAMVSATVVSYFHTTSVDLIVSEARNSTELPFVLNCYSGETVTKSLTIHNNANVPLKAELSWNESSNTEGVIYTSNMPLIVVLDPTADTIADVSMTCDEVTPAGTVSGTINYLATK